MEKFVLNHETALRLGIAGAILLLMVLWEYLLPRRARRYARSQRWLQNIGLMACGIASLRIVFFPLTTVAFAALVKNQGMGLLHYLALPTIPATICAIVLLDMGIYAQHVLSHRLPILWRLHRVHHADPDLDVTTALRFHPGEIVLSMACKFILIALIGPPLVAVVLFEILLNGAAMFNHGNVVLPLRLDHYLRYLLITPDMHRVHHSASSDETNCNYGFSIALWDRLFRTYRASPAAGHHAMTIGMPLADGYFTCVGLLRMLRLPFSHPQAQPPLPDSGQR